MGLGEYAKEFGFYPVGGRQPLIKSELGRAGMKHALGSCCGGIHGMDGAGRGSYRDDMRGMDGGGRGSYRDDIHRMDGGGRDRRREAGWGSCSDGPPWGVRVSVGVGN